MQDISKINGLFSKDGYWWSFGVVGRSLNNRQKQFCGEAVGVWTNGLSGSGTLKHNTNRHLFWVIASFWVSVVHVKHKFAMQFLTFRFSIFDLALCKRILSAACHTQAYQEESYAINGCIKDVHLNCLCSILQVGNQFSRFISFQSHLCLRPHQCVQSYWPKSFLVRWAHHLFQVDTIY